MINILYSSWNRIEYTSASFAALVVNTDWAKVAAFHIADDGSTDGTGKFLSDARDAIPDHVDVRYESRRLGGPVAAMLRHLQILPMTDEVEAFVKIDSDFIVPPGWLPELLRVSAADPGVDIIGIQPRFGPPVPGACKERRIEAARHIGGIGLMRHRAFEVCRPVANGRYGWTEHQTRHPESRKGWIVPDLPAFCLDLIDLEPWASLGERYIEQGWQRPWPKYLNGGREYYEWWAT